MIKMLMRISSQPFVNLDFLSRPLHTWGNFEKILVALGNSLGLEKEQKGQVRRRLDQQLQ